VQQPAAAQIDNSNAIVFELGDKHMLARRIECEMIDAAVDRPKWDLVLHHERDTQNCSYQHSVRHPRSRWNFDQQNTRSLKQI
jgi:hypothetical protein